MGNISLSKIRKNVGRIITKKIVFPLVFNLESLKPIQENKVIFLELRLPALSNSFQELYNELVRNYELDIHCHFFRIGFVSKDEQYKRFLDFVKDAATAKYLIYAEGSDVHACLKKRKGQHILNTWHAAGAFKRFGLSTADKIFGDSYREAKRFPSHGDYDLVTVSSPEVIWAYAEAMDKKDRPECIQPLGLSRTDIFFRKETIDKAYKHLYNLVPQAMNKKVITYAPTFRGRSNRAYTPGLLNVEKFYNELKDDYVLIYKHHPITKNRPQIPAQFSNFAIDLTELLTIEELICVTDIMITDYSSTVFEYSLFEKPIVFFAYDLYDYYDWRGFYYDYEELTPGPVCFTNKEIIDYIKNIDERFDKDKIRLFKKRFMSSCDGCATKRIMKNFFEPSLEKYKRREPLEGFYHMYPDWVERFYNKNEFYKKELQIKNIVKKEYEKVAKQPINNRSLVLIADELTDSAVFGSLIQILNKNGNFNVYEKLVFSADDKMQTKKSASILAQAQYIVVAGEPYVLRMIDIRPETKVIQICPSLLPIKPKWNNDPINRAGINLSDKKEFPIHTKYDVVMSTSPKADELYIRNYPLKENGSIWHIGNVSTDVLKDKSFAQETRNGFYESHPYAKGKKIILMLCTPRGNLEDYLEKLLLEMHEDFAREYIVILKADESFRKIRIPDYLKGFAIQMNMSSLECISIADIVIGDYGSDIYGAIVAGKDFYRWLPDSCIYIESNEWYMDIMKLLPERICNTNKQLIDRIQNKSNGKNTIKQSELYSQFMKEHLYNCDGATSERFVERL